MPDTEKPTTETKAPEAEAATPTVEELTAQLETLTGKYERAQKDLGKFRTRADELEAARKTAEEKALSEKGLQEQLDATRKQLTEKEQAAADAAARATAAERRAALAGKVADPTAALKLLDETKHLDSDGQVKVDDLLKDYPFLALRDANRVDLPGSRSAPAGSGPLKPSDFEGKPREWIDANIHRLTHKKG